MLICVVILFLLCWGPRFIMELLMKMQFSWLYYEHVYVIRIILFLLPMVHAILNPVVYFVMSRNFRKSVVKNCAKCNKNNAQGSFEDLEMKAKKSQTIVVSNQKEQNKHELVVVRENGEVTVDLIETCQEIA